MRTAVLLAVLVILGIGIALACDGDGCEVVCEQTVNNYETTHVTQQISTDDQYRKFRTYVGGDLRFLELSDNVGLEAQYRFNPEMSGSKEQHYAGLVLKVDITGGEKK